ncbi:glycoside hydrolase family 16 protein [Mycena belliarum]|uniref:Glycoside hydrolase family 16 protein n=1 Tax=Mycena belliarum TaxID=1033014 RepID=A0AAD6U725_9AGAR|nr:glycoside hydrolase family 16 protein [Mycena belliae]
MTRATALFALTLLARCLPSSATYYPFVNYEGATFFDGFDFYGAIDNTTWGNVTYVTAADARAESLAYINDEGNAMIKVDAASTVLAAGIQYRKSVRLTSKAEFSVGTLFVIDAIHMPYGCSVWPSIWFNGVLKPGQVWPQAGEIDFIEAINLMDHNQMALHSYAGCVQPPNVTQTGRTILHNCNDTTSSGCTVAESKPNSFGAGFAQAGGGAFGMQFDVAGIFMWFWSRSSIPNSITSATATSQMDIADWGVPSAAYPAAGCNITEFFPAQQMVIDITLCGLWAGANGIYESSTCPGTCFGSNIAGNGSNYASAYFEIPAIRTWTVDPGAAASASSSIASASATQQSSASVAAQDSHTTGKTTPNGARRSGADWGALGVGLGVGLWVGLGLYS